MKTIPVQEELRRGFGALEANRLEEAAACCRRVLAAQPQLVEGHFLVGLVALAMEDKKTAVSAFGSVIKLKPDHAAAWAQLARLFATLGHANRADRALREAGANEAGDPLVQDLIGTAYSLLGDQVTAHSWFCRAVKGQPGNIGFGVNLANACLYLGRLDEAQAGLQKALESAPGNAQAHWLLSGLRRATDSQHVEQLQQLIARQGQPARTQSFLNYALGKELEDLEQWDAAFEAFSRGAAARRTTVQFDEAAEVAMFAEFERLFTQAWLEHGEQGSDAPGPVFVVGQPRTGTTLVERIITSHSQVHSAGELQHLGLCVRRLGDYSAPQRFSPRLAEIAASVPPARLGEQYLAACASQRGSEPRFVDKLPVNYLFLPLILKALPGARVVHVVRDPMDACFASFKQLFADAYPHSYEQAEMARHHARYRRLTGVWRERFGERFIEVAYEDVARDVEPHAMRIIDYLGLDWQPACLEFYSQNAPVATASAVQVREPAHTRSIGRWRRYQRQLEPMRRELEAQGITVS